MPVKKCNIITYIICAICMMYYILRCLSVHGMDVEDFLRQAGMLMPAPLKGPLKAIY